MDNRIFPESMISYLCREVASNGTILPSRHRYFRRTHTTVWYDLQGTDILAVRPFISTECTTIRARAASTLETPAKLFSPELNFCFIFRFFYTAYEQYLHIVGDAVRNLSLSIAATFLVIFILLGFDLWSALMILVPVLMIMLSMFGVMYLWNIPLNALSLVNLVMVSKDILIFGH